MYQYTHSRSVFLQSQSLVAYLLIKIKITETTFRLDWELELIIKSVSYVSHLHLTELTIGPGGPLSPGGPFKPCSPFKNKHLN